MNKKKILAVALSCSLAFSSVPAVFADTAIPADSLAAKNLGMLVGKDSTGVTSAYVNENPTRIQAAIMFLRLRGLFETATAFNGTDNFADAKDMQWAEGKKIMAYLKANPELGFVGTGNNTFNANEKIDAASYYKVMLEALGYKAGVDFTWEQVKTFAASKGLSKVANDTNFQVADIATATIEALKAEVKGGSKTLIAQLLETGVVTAEAAKAAGLVGDTAVTSIKAASVKSFKVTFASAVADTSKVAFEVKRQTTPVTVTATWNEAKTEATLTSAANFAEATFAVNVKADGKDIATENVTITAQKVAKLEFTSKAVAVNLSTGKGFVNYKVFDQYNNDITANYLANNLTWQTGAGTVSAKNGLATITPGATPLVQFQNISVIAYDTNSGVSSTVTLPTSSAIGTLSDFQLGSVADVKLVDGDVTSVFYIPFTAKDMSGNDTKDYDLIMGGLILQNTNELTVSLGSNVSAKIVQDPADSKKAAVEVRVKAGTPIVMDMPVTITAMSFSGKTSSVQTTLVKAKALNSVTLFAPSATVAVGETPELAFEAYDQHGNKITKYSEINGLVTPTGFSIEKKVDGNAKFVMNSVANKGVTTISAVVNATGKMSTLNINVQEAAVPSRIAIDSSVLVGAMEHGATQDIGLDGSTPKGLKVYDQYDREMSSSKITSKFNGGADYKVAVSNANGEIDPSVANFTTGTGVVTLTADAVNGGAGTVKFELVDVQDANRVLSTASASIAVIKTADIADYTINTFDKAIYAGGNATAKEQAYKAEIEVFGKTASGAKVVLAGTPIVGAAVENTTDFNAILGSGAWDSVAVTANALTATKTTAKTVATVTLNHNNKVTALKTNVESSYTAPVVSTIAAKGTTEDKITLTVAQYNALLNEYVTEYTAAGAAATKADFYFRVTDSYGKYAMAPAQIIVDVKNAAGAAGTSTFTLTNGQITAVNGVAGDVVYVTAITNNGLVKTIQVNITN